MNAPTQPSAPLGVDYSRKWMVMATVSMGVLLATIDGSIVNVALPTMVDSFGTTFAVIQWVSLAYLLALATLTLGMGRLGDVVGKKRIYTTGFSAFTAASVLCGLAPTVGFLIGFRVVQAVGATMILALGAAILTEAFPPSERGKALGLIGTAVSVGIITGPVVGGVLIASFDWRAIFFVNLPVGLVGTLMAIRLIPDTPPAGGQRMDYPGAAILSATLLSLALALTLGQEAGYSSPLILGLLAVAAVGAVTFVTYELRVPNPMVNLSLFRNPLLSVSVVTGFMVFTAVSAVFLLLPFYLGGVLGFPIRQVGLLLGAGPLVLGIVAPMSGAFSDRVGVRSLTLTGLLILTATFLAFRILTTTTAWWEYVLLAVPIGLGIGIFQSPNNSAIMGSVPREYSGVAGGLLTLTRLLGQITGVAVLGSLWAARVVAISGGAVPGGDATRATPQAQVEGIHDTFGVAALMMIVAAGLGFWGFRRERAMRSHQSA